MELNNYYSFNSKFLIEDISSDLLKFFGKNPPIIVCLGSDKVLGDMVGVFVADFLKQSNIKSIVFGGTRHNATKTMFMNIIKRFKTKNILIVDSGITNFGDIKVCDKTKLSNGVVIDYPSIVAGTIKIFDNKLKAHLNFDLNLIQNKFLNLEYNYLYYILKMLANLQFHKK